jgi:hypothetical protein
MTAFPPEASSSPETTNNQHLCGMRYKDKHSAVLSLDLCTESKCHRTPRRNNLALAITAVQIHPITRT